MGLERIGQEEYPRAADGMGIGTIDGVAAVNVWELVFVWHSWSRTLHWRNSLGKKDVSNTFLYSDRIRTTV